MSLTSRPIELIAPILKIRKVMQNVKIGVVWGGNGSGYGNVTVGQIAYKFLFDFS